MGTDTDSIIIAAILVVVVLVGMRLIYGYWPWQEDPHVRTLRKLAQPVREPDPAVNEPGNSFDRGKEVAAPGDPDSDQVKGG